MPPSARYGATSTEAPPSTRREKAAPSGAAFLLRTSAIASLRSRSGVLHEPPGHPDDHRQSIRAAATFALPEAARSEEHTSELPSLMRNSYAVFCLKKKKIITNHWYKSTSTHDNLMRHPH